MLRIKTLIKDVVEPKIIAQDESLLAFCFFCFVIFPIFPIQIKTTIVASWNNDNNAYLSIQKVGFKKCHFFRIIVQKLLCIISFSKIFINFIYRKNRSIFDQKTQKNIYLQNHTHKYENELG